MVTRYNLPANQPLINTYTPLPFNELLLAGQSMQKQKDDLEIQRLDLAGKDVFHLPQDEQGAKSAQDWLNSESEKIAGLYGTNLRSAKQAMQNFKLEAAKRFGEFGDIGAYNKSVSNYQSYVQDLDEKVKNKTLDPHTRDLLISEAMSNYKGIGEYNPTKGYNTFSGNTAAIHQDLPKWIKDNLSDLEAITNATASAGPDGKGYIFTDKSTGEVVSPERVKAAFTQLANSDESLMNWVSEGDRLGVDRLAMLNSAGSAGVTKYAYYKNTRDKSAFTDGTWKYGQEQKALEKANNPLISADYQQQVKDELTDAANTPLGNVLGQDVKPSGIEIFKVADGNISNKIAELERSLVKIKDPSTGEYKISESSDNQLKLQQIQDLKNEQEKNRSLRLNFEKQAYNVDDNYLRSNGFNSLSEYKSYLKDFKTEAEQLFKDKSTLNQELQGLKTETLNLSNGRISITFDDKGFAKVSLKDTPDRNVGGTMGGVSAVPIDQEALEYAKEKVAAYNDYKQSMEEKLDIQASNLNNSYNRISGTKADNFTYKSAESLYNSINSAEASANSLANSYVNNRTVTTPIFSFSPDQVANSNMLSQMEKLMNTDEFTFTTKDENGRDVKYNPYTITTGKDNPFSIGKSMNNITFSSIGVDQDGKVILYGIDTKTNKMLKADFTRGLETTNFLPEFYNQAKNMYINAANTGDTKGMGDAMIFMAVTSPDSKLGSSYKQINKEVNDLAEGVSSGDKNDLIISKPIQTAYGDIYISKDAVADQNGKQYNVYSPSISKEDIKSGKLWDKYNIQLNQDGDAFIIQDGEPVLIMQRLSYDEITPTLLQQTGYF